MKLMKLVGMGALAAAAAGTMFVLMTPPAQAADHLDPPSVTLGNSADIGDLYAFTRTVGQTDKLVVVLTFGGPLAPVAGQMASLDADTVYEIHIDRGTVAMPVDQTPDVSIDVRFAQNDLGNWGVRAVNIPGSSGAIVGNIEQTLTDNFVNVWTGLREDPFFFDLQGFQETVMTGDLAFLNTRDRFSGENISAIVIEMPLDGAPLAGADTLDIWATTSDVGN